MSGHTTYHLRTFQRGRLAATNRSFNGKPKATAQPKLANAVAFGSPLNDDALVAKGRLYRRVTRVSKFTCLNAFWIQKIGPNRVAHEQSLASQPELRINNFEHS